MGGFLFARPPDAGKFVPLFLPARIEAPHLAAHRFEFAEGIQQAEVDIGFEQQLVFVLSGNRYQERGKLLELLHRGRLVVDEDTVAPAAVDAPADHELMTGRIDSPRAQVFPA